MAVPTLFILIVATQCEINCQNVGISKRYSAKSEKYSYNLISV